MATGSLQSTFNSLHSHSVPGFKALPTCPVPTSEVFQKVHGLNLLLQPHLHMFCILPGVFKATSSLAGLIWALAVSGFNAEMPPWAWQVRKSLPREGTPCRYHGRGGLGWMESI